jgi:23S rRNA (adenine2503-C2)-methyltransferase
MEVVEIFNSEDMRTHKFRVSMDDGCVSEVVRVDHPSAKRIICFSTQIGCSRGCPFCASGVGGIKRSLTVDEMVYLMWVGYGNGCPQPILFSAMGSGEPMDNIQALQDAFIRARITITANSKCAMSTICRSTINVRSAMEWAKKWEIPLKVQVSLHAASPFLRKRLIPQAVDPPSAIAKLLYPFRKDVELNVVLWDRLNDCPQDAHRLAKEFGPGWRVKLNRYNPAVPSWDFHASTPERASKFAEILVRSGMEVEHYRTDGVDIQAACGQLIGAK